MLEDDRRRRARRLLWVWAVVATLTVAYVAFILASSVPVTPDDVDAFRWDPSASSFDTRDRLVTVPVRGVDDVTTLAAAGPTERVLGARGDVIRFTDTPAEPAPRGPFPWPNAEGGLARALLYAEREDANATTWRVPALNLTNVTSVNLTNVPFPPQGPVNASAGILWASNLTVIERDGDAWNATFGHDRRGVLANVTVNLSAFEGTHGFIVKEDAASSVVPFLVPPESVTGKVVRATPAPSLYAALAFSGLGAAFPLALLALTARNRGPPGLTGSLPTGACPECRAPMDASLEFCSRCGAYRKRA